MKKLLIIPALVIILVGSVVLTHVFSQQTTKGLSITPYNVELTISPGNSVTKTVTLTNLTDKSVAITVDKRNFTANGEEGAIALTNTDSNANYSLLSWTTISPSTVTLAPGAKQDFQITITVPKAAEPGGHFGSFVFATVPAKNVQGTGALLSQEIAGIILVKIPGDVKESASIASFQADKKFFEFGPVPFTVRVKNDSNVHITPSGTITIKNMWGQTFTTSIDSRNVLPGAIRKIPALWQHTLLIGKYTASLSLAYGSSSTPRLVATTTFYGFPVRIALVVLVLLIILFLMRRRLLKALKTLATGK